MTRRPTVVRRGSTGRTPLGTSGRGRLKILNSPGVETGHALVEGSHTAGESRIGDHVHGRHEETFIVLEGRYQMRLGDEVVSVQTGDYVVVPRGTHHT